MPERGAIARICLTFEARMAWGDMRLKLAIAALVGIAATGAFRTISAQGKTQWDGVYTAEQATRGQVAYTNSCAACHGSDLNGTDVPSLTGADFLRNWSDSTVGQLFERIKFSMPLDTPGTLSPQQAADIVAFILQKGNFPAGQSELPSQVEGLNGIKFSATKP